MLENIHGTRLSSTLSQSSRALIIVKSMMGIIFEWYQFCVYAYFSPIIGQLFFPTEDKTLQLMATWGTFFIGYLARPLGGLFFGVMGDRHGRKQVMVWTLILMAIPTTLMGLLPTYHEIGIFATIALLCLRVLQGISMGGNYGGSITFLFEHSSQHRKAFMSSFSVLGVLTGIFLGSLTVFLFNKFMSEEFLLTYGFRIPFILGFFVFLWAMMLRKTLPESPVFEKTKREGALQVNPLQTLWKEHRFSLFTLLGVVILHDLSFYIIFLFMPTYLTQSLSFSKDAIFMLNSVCLIVVAITVVITAWYSDTFGRVFFMKMAAWFFALMSIPLLWVMTNPNLYGIPFAISFVILAIAVGVFLAPMPALMVETFPSAVRNIGITVTGNISGPVFGGSAPLVLAYLTEVLQLNLAPALYLTLSALVTITALKFIKPIYTQDS